MKLLITPGNVIDTRMLLEIKSGEGLHARLIEWRGAKDLNLAERAGFFHKVVPTLQRLFNRRCLSRNCFQSSNVILAQRLDVSFCFLVEFKREFRKSRQ